MSVDMKIIMKIFVKISRTSFLLFFSWPNSRSNHLMIVLILLEVRNLNIFKNSFDEICKYGYFDQY